jgi:nucleotide-binding universal stress UspA family protein
MNFKKILVPVDFSEGSVNALRYAAAFAKSSEGVIDLLHVTDPNALANELKGNLDPQHLFGLITKEEYMAGIHLNFEMADGNTTDLIIDFSKKNNSDLIVMGTEGAHGLKRNFLGTHTTGVIRKTSCTVLAVPADSVFTGFRKVVIGVDLEHRADELLEETIILLGKMEATIFLVYTNNENLENGETELQLLARELKSKTGYSKIEEHIINSHTFSEGMTSFTRDIEAELLIMFTHHRGVFERIFDPSLSQRFAYHSPAPLMVVPYQKKPVFFF